MPTTPSVATIGNLIFPCLKPNTPSTSTPISIVLAWVDPSEIAISEIQRHFVWHLTPVRDWMDSLLKAFPVGSPIAWKSLIVKLKDSFTSEGKHIHTHGMGFFAESIKVSLALLIRSSQADWAFEIFGVDRLSALSNLQCSLIGHVPGDLVDDRHLFAPVVL